MTKYGQNTILESYIYPNGAGRNFLLTKKTDLGNVQQFRKFGAMRAKLKVLTCPNMDKSADLEISDLEPN